VLGNLDRGRLAAGIDDLRLAPLGNLAGCCLAALAGKAKPTATLRSLSVLVGRHGQINPAAKVRGRSPIAPAEDECRGYRDRDASNGVRRKPSITGKWLSIRKSLVAALRRHESCDRELERHLTSGLGSHMDDARHVHLKRLGPTPPNTYKLVMREEPFHGVRAIRLVPVGDGNMFGRDGLLAHSYMLGPNGQSNGCVSFSDYPAFLDAYLRGEVDRLMVVEHLATAPGPRTASGWVPEFIKDLFRRS